MSLYNVIERLNEIRTLKVLFVGDTIIDEYCYVTPLQRSPKEPIIPARIESREVFRGGVEAAANHARSFCQQVDVASYGPVTKKTRMIEVGTMRKLFETHETTGINDRGGEPGSAYDVLVVTDFGHGEFRKDQRQWLCEQPGYLCVNAQTNSANFGFNLITQYERADYVVIDEPEARLAAHDRESPIEHVLETLAANRFTKMIITRGSDGAIGYDGTGFARMKAFAKRPMDTMGAGDAFYAVTAPLSPIASLEELLLIGSAAAAIKCDIVGHRTPVTKQDVITFLESIA